MSRAGRILELFGQSAGANLDLNNKVAMKCRSCGYMKSMPFGILAPQGTISNIGESYLDKPLPDEKKMVKPNARGKDAVYPDAEDVSTRLTDQKCPKCGDMMEVHFTSSRVMGGQSGPRAQTAPGGALSGGAYH